MQWILIKLTLALAKKLRVLILTNEDQLTNKLYLNCYSVEHNEIRLSN